MQQKNSINENTPELCGCQVLRWRPQMMMSSQEKSLSIISCFLFGQMHFLLSAVTSIQHKSNSFVCFLFTFLPPSFLLSIGRLHNCHMAVHLSSHCKCVAIYENFFPFQHDAVLKLMKHPSDLVVTLPPCNIWWLLEARCETQ